MLRSLVVCAVVVGVSGCSAFGYKDNEAYKDELCNNIGTMYYQIAEAKRQGMSPVQMWRAIELGIVDTMESDDISDAEVQALRTWGKSALDNVYTSDKSFKSEDWRATAINQCQSQVNVYY